MNEKYFFDFDQDGHWYLVPATKRKLFMSFTVNDSEDEDEIEKFENKFGKYRIGCHPSCYMFEHPRKFE